MEKNWKNISFCCPSETDTILYINYTSIKNIFFQDEVCNNMEIDDVAFYFLKAWLH